MNLILDKKIILCRAGSVPGPAHSMETAEASEGTGKNCSDGPSQQYTCTYTNTHTYIARYKVGLGHKSCGRIPCFAHVQYDCYCFV